MTKIYSVGGLLPPDKPLIAQRPFRSPHYTISNAGLVGGGRLPRPGEITFSHRGVLFLDELPESGHSALEALRQPMEDKVVTISRAGGTITFPANFALIGALNPCPCGFYSHPTRECLCSPSQISRYQKRISGPLLDRIDIFTEVPPVEYEKLVGVDSEESSSQVRQRDTEAKVPGQRLHLQRGDGSRRGVELLRPGGERHGPPPGRDEAAGPVGPGLPPHPQALFDHSRPGRLRHHRHGPRRRGAAVPATGVLAKLGRKLTSCLPQREEIWSKCLT